MGTTIGNRGYQATIVQAVDAFGQMLSTKM